MQTTVLLVGIGRESEGMVARAVAEAAVRSHSVVDLSSAMEYLESCAAAPAAIVLDISGSDTAGTQELAAIRRVAPQAAVVMTAETASTGQVVTALKSGAADFISGAGAEEEWRKAIGAAVKERPVAGVRPRPEPVIAGVFVGRSPGMAAIAGTLKQVAWTEIPVLIQGETGSGKEVVARALHAHSRRANKPFFKLNCAALPSELVESELFGYERGAFTGAFQRKPGIFEAADGGTVLLDEIGDMDVRLQAKLLQVLQDHSFQRIGGKELIHVDVRVVAATHRNLEKSIEEGTFREDLYYRLNVINIVVPSLRERKEDLFELTEVLLRKHMKAGDAMPVFTPGLREAMMAWHWPGNVRELENFARKLLIFRNSDYAERELRSLMLRRGSADQRRKAAELPVAPSPVETDGPSGPVRLPAMAEVEQVTRRAEAEAILAALNAAHWNRRVAATLLNVDYKCLLYRMKKLGIEAQKRGAPAGALPAAESVPSTANAEEWPSGVKTAAAGFSAA